MEVIAWGLGLIAATIGIGYFLRDISRWIWSIRFKVYRSIWGRSGSLNRILETGTIRVGVAHYPPLSFISKRLDKTGYEAFGPVFELVRRLAEAKSIEIEVVPLQWHLLGEHFSQDGCDLLCPIFPTDIRAKYGTVVGVAYSIGLAGVSKVDNQNVTNSDSLRDSEVRVAVTDGEVGWEFMRDKFPEKFRSVETLVSQSHDITDTMGAVLNERADIALADALSCFRFLQEHDPEGQSLKNPLQGEPLRSFQCGFMVPKAEAKFGEWLESEIAKIRISEDFLQYEAKALSGWSNIISRQVPEGVDLPRVRKN